eukprot:528814_1
MLILCINQVSNNHFSMLVQLLTAFLSVICLWIYLYFVNVKNWWFYYRYKWTLHRMQLKWQRMIDNDYALHTNNWYFNNIHKYGDIKFISKLFAVFHSFGLLITLTCVPLYKLVHPVFVSGMFSLIIAAGFYVFIYCKTPPFNDGYWIHWESQMHSKLSLVLIIGICIVTILNMILHDRLLFNLIITMVINSFLFASNCISTFVIISKNHKFHGSMRTLSIDSNSVSQCNLITVTMPHPTFHKTDSMKQRSRKITLQMILENKRTIHSFMNHLSREFSMECLLAFVEFSQYQDYANHRLEASVRRTKVQFPSNIPVSSIVGTTEAVQMSDEQFVKDVKQKAHKLYNKYMTSSSEFEINIPYQQKLKATEMLEDEKKLVDGTSVTLGGLFAMFEAVNNEMYSLLQYSLDRLKYEPEFDEIIAVFEREVDKGTTHDTI